MYYTPIVLVPLCAFGVVYSAVEKWSDEVLTKADILNFAGQYLTFCGAFCLGFYIFAYEREKSREQQIDEIDYFVDVINRSVTDSINLRNITENALSDDELKGQVGLITTVENWYYYYKKYERLYRKNSELERAMEIYFSRIEKINRLIKEGLFIEANKLSQDYIRDDYYNTMAYNPSTLLLEIKEASPGFGNRKDWFRQKATKRLVSDICEHYADIIETLIYNYMKTKRLKQANSHNVNIEVTDQMIEMSEYLKSIVVFPNDRRIITKAIEICSYSFPKYSKTHRIKLVWGEYFMCDE